MTRSRNSLFIFLLVAVVGCSTVGWESIDESGITVIIKEDFEDFDAISISHGFKGEVVQGNRFDVSVEIDENLEDRLVLRKRGDVLEIGLKNGTSWNGERPRFEITMPVLTEVDGSGAAYILMEGFEYDGEFVADLSGASTLEGDIETEDLDIDVSGASTVELDGAVRDVYIDASGASRAMIQDMEANDIRFDISGASSARVHLTGELKGSASGASSLRYSGNPRDVDISTSGASSVRED